MAGQRQNPVTVVVLILVIALSLSFIVYRLIPKRYPRPLVDWTCQTCGYKFIAESQRESRICPEDGGEALRTYYYYCSEHNHLFEAYLSKPNPEFEEREPGPPMMMEQLTLYKIPDGEWTTKYPTEIVCPEGNSDRQTLEYAPPTSERRKLKET